MEKYFVEIFQLICSPLVKLVKWFFLKVRIAIFRIKNRKSPFNELKAHQIAYAVLSGYIVYAIPYRNIDSKHIFMAVVRRSSEDNLDNQIYILEQVGNKFRSTWNYETILEPSHFEVVDINGDGIHEVVFTEESFGTGGGSWIMFVYCSAKKKLFQIREFYDWSNAAGPFLPKIEIAPKNNDDFIHYIENYAVKLGFLQLKLPDLDSPDFAVQKWHYLNGRRKRGTVRLHFYNNRPYFAASVSATLDTTDIFWISYFKGPLFGYIKSKNQNFIAYSPSWIYDWITCLAYDGENLWFGIHCEPWLMSFKFEKEHGYLNCYTHFKGKELPEVESIECYRGGIILNDEIIIYVNDLQKLETKELDL